MALDMLIETCEQRRLLAATGMSEAPAAMAMSITLMADGTLRVYGSDDAEMLSVVHVGADVEVLVDGLSAAVFPSQLVTRVRLDARGGGDHINYETSQPAEIRAGDGNDFVSAGPIDSPMVISIDGGRGDDSVMLLGANQSTVSGGQGDDMINVGFGFSLELHGNAGNDVIRLAPVDASAPLFDISADGGAGDDSLVVIDSELITLHGGSGDDTFSYQGPEAYDLRGDSGNDWFRNISPDEAPVQALIDGGSGIDTWDWSSNQVATLRMGPGLEVFLGSTVVLEGNELDNTIGAGYASTVHAGSGDDLVVTSLLGFSQIDGGDGRDTIIGSIDGQDTLAGGDGNDLIRALEETFAFFGPATMLGGDGNDTLLGGATNDSIDGGAGRDLLVGGAGDDTLSGGPGRDSLIGGEGFDIAISPDDDELEGIESIIL